MKYRLLIDCPDQAGLVAAVSQLIADFKGSIHEADHHTDVSANWFFMRHELVFPEGTAIHSFELELKALAQRDRMRYQLVDTSKPQRVVIMVSKQLHCLADLLYRWNANEMPCEVVAVLSNHQDAARLTESYHLPYEHVPIDKNNKTAGFAATAEVLERYQPDVIVLARYMQVLPADIVTQYENRIINIHHSFLPSFVGAKPYHQAYERGVKLVGATCHYVTDELDQGPIIEQDVLRISHRQQVGDLVRLGKDVEKSVLARGLHKHCEQRVAVLGNKTLVFT